MAYKIIPAFLLWLAIGWSITTAQEPPPDFQIKDTGPPQLSALSEPVQPPGPDAVTIPGVPLYIWHHGCVPTSAGMLLGYYDSHGFPGLIPGEAITQTLAVNEAIASGGNVAEYAQPYDPPGSGPLLPDISELPLGDEHPDDSIADYIKTSQSRQGNRYGWTWLSDLWYFLPLYFNDHLPPDYEAEPVWYSLVEFEQYRVAIDSGHPIIVFVDSSGDGVIDHATVGVGYEVVDGVERYIVHDTHTGYPRSEPFRPLSPEYVYGVGGGQGIEMMWTGRVYLPIVFR